MSKVTVIIAEEISSGKPVSFGESAWSKKKLTGQYKFVEERVMDGTPAPTPANQKTAAIGMPKKIQVKSFKQPAKINTGGGGCGC